MSFDNARMGIGLIAAAPQTHCSCITNGGDMNNTRFDHRCCIRFVMDKAFTQCTCLAIFGTADSFLIILDLHLKQSTAMEVPSTFHINYTIKETNNTGDLFVSLLSKDLFASYFLCLVFIQSTYLKDVVITMHVCPIIFIPFLL